MEDYPGNSNRAKKESAPKKQIEKAIAGEVVLRKKPLGRKFVETFIQGDPRQAWGDAVWKVMIPALKDMAFEMVKSGASGTLFGEAAAAAHRRTSSNGTYVSYGNMSKAKPSAFIGDPRQGPSKKDRAVHNFDQVVFEHRHEALTVIDRLYEIIANYEAASVKDMYELAGIDADYTDAKWGWTDLRGTEPVPVRGGYIISLPRPVPID